MLPGEGAAASGGLGVRAQSKRCLGRGREAGRPACRPPVSACSRVHVSACSRVHVSVCLRVRVTACSHVVLGRRRIGCGRRPAPADRHRWPRPLGPHAHTSPPARGFVCSVRWAGPGRGRPVSRPPKRAGPLPTIPAVAGQRDTWVCEPWPWPLLLAPSAFGGGACSWEVTVSWAAARPLAGWRASPRGSGPRVLGQCTGRPPVLQGPGKGALWGRGGAPRSHRQGQGGPQPRPGPEAEWPPRTAVRSDTLGLGKTIPRDLGCSLGPRSMR